MTTLNTIQELTQKIHKHCPELMELSFGCVIKNNNKEYRLDSNWCIETRSRNFINDYRVIRNEYNDWTEIDENSFVILGHPITLEHVLKAIYAKGPEWKTRLTLECDGQFVVADGPFLEKTAYATWSLTKPLSEQSEETIKWLNKIIV